MIAKLEALVARYNDSTNDRYRWRLVAKAAALSRVRAGWMLLRPDFPREKMLKDDGTSTGQVKALRTAWPAKIAGVLIKDQADAAAFLACVVGQG